MNKRIVEGYEMFFKDDIKIIDDEVKKSLSLPLPLLFLRDELQIIYNGHIFLATTSTANRIPDTLIKIYTKSYGIKKATTSRGKIETFKAQEDKYFKDNKSLIEKVQAEFINKSIGGYSAGAEKNAYLEYGGGLLKEQTASELTNKINKIYAQKKIKLPPNQAARRNIEYLDDGSVFNSNFKKSAGLLLLDEKAYVLETMPEFIRRFKDGIRYSLYNSLESSCLESTPEEIAKYLIMHQDEVDKKALSAILSKLWHGKASFKFMLDKTYFVPDYIGSVKELQEAYTSLIEKEIKLEAIKKYL